jgi:glycerophosphoryl diester phosphodiesterase
MPAVHVDSIGLGPFSNIYLDEPSAWTAGFDPATHGGSVPSSVKAAGGAIWSPFCRDVDAKSIEEAHRLGLKVVVWTVNRPEDMVHMIDRRVDGIISDRPDLLRSVAAGKGVLLPRPYPVTP